MWQAEKCTKQHQFLVGQKQWNWNMEIHFLVLFHNPLQCQQAYNDLDARNADIKIGIRPAGKYSPTHKSSSKRTPTMPDRFLFVPAHTTRTKHTAAYFMNTLYAVRYSKYNWLKSLCRKGTVTVTIIIADKTSYKHTPNSVTSLGQAVGQTLHTQRSTVYSDFWEQAFVQFRCAVSWVFNDAVKLVKLVISESRTLVTVRYTFTELPKHSHRDAETQTAIP